MIILPEWLQKMPDGPEKDKKTNRFYMRLASLYATEGGRLADLAFLIGINYRTLQSQALHIPASTATKEAIKRLIGPSFVPPDCKRNAKNPL